MKKVPYTILLFLISLQGFTQINNLTDLLDVSKLTLQEMVSELQYTWETQQPEQITTEKGFVTERYKFIYKQENAKQILQRSCRIELQTTLTFCITNFIFSDKALLDRIVKNLKYNGYELKGTQGKQSMYEDGNNVITVDTNFKNVKGVIVYNIGVVIGSKNSNVNPNIKPETKAPKKEIIKFCEEFDAWYYIVEIEGENIVFKSYPTLTNTYHKNKGINEIFKGKIKNGIITIERPKNCSDCGVGFEKGKFKIENDILYDANNEGGYNEYFKCN